MAQQQKTNIEVFVSTWRRLQERKTGPGDSFDTVINRSLDKLEEFEDESDDAGDTNDEQHSDDELDPIEEIVEELDPQRYGKPDQAKREVARAALEFLRDRGHAHRNVVQEEQGENLPDPDVAPATYWQQYVRPVFQEAAELGYVEFREDERPKGYVWIGE
jgi:hypothetical protein